MAGAAFRKDALRQRHADPACELGVCRHRARICFATESKPRLAGCCARCASTAAVSPPAWTPIATARRGSYYTWDHAEIDVVLGDRYGDIPRQLHLGNAAGLGRQADHPREHGSSSGRRDDNSALADQIVRRPRKTHSPRARRQGACRLERSGDCRVGRGIAQPEPVRLAGSGKGRLPFRFRIKDAPTVACRTRSLATGVFSLRCLPTMHAMANAAIALYEATADAAYLDRGRFASRRTRPLVYRRRERRPLPDGGRQPRRADPHPW